MDDSDKTAKPTFDKDAAKALVEKALAKTTSDMPPEYGSEQSDIEGAQEAIACIAQLIQSEAAELADRPCELRDIQILTDAVCSLHCFISREQQQAMGGSGDGGPPSMLFAALADLKKAAKEPYGDVSYADPGYLADKKKRYPLNNKERARAAWGYINQKDNADEYTADQLKKVRARIMAACEKFGVDVDESKKSTDVDVVKTVSDSQLKADEVMEGLDGSTDEVGIEKTADPEATKAATVEDDGPDSDTLVKAWTVMFEKADNPLRKMLEGIESSTKSAVEALSDLSARVEKVESMPLPGGPALRRTETEKKTAEKADLLREADRWRIKSESVTDPDLRKGYAQTAAEFLRKARSLDV
jgi:hypothetical protein